MTELAFVVSEHQNGFFSELVAALRYELKALGVTTLVSQAGFPPVRDGLVYVVVPPHEYVKLEPASWPERAVLARTIGISAEQPGTSYFEDGVALAWELGAVFDISRSAVDELARRRLRARHLQLGYTTFWDRSRPPSERDVDLVFIGAKTLRREQLLARHAHSFWRWRSRLLVSDNSGPNTAETPGFLSGEAKWELLGRSRVLLNVHQGAPPYFEWLRIVEAIANGVAVVSELSEDVAPLRVGEHLLAGRYETLALLAQSLLERPDQLDALATSARQFLQKEVPLAAAAERLANAADDLARRPPAVGKIRRRIPTKPFRRQPFRPVHGEIDPKEALLRQTLKELMLEVRELRRRVEHAVQGEEAGARIVAQSAAHEFTRPQVSVLTALFEDGRHVVDALDSVVRGRFTDYELVVVDDGSADDSPARVRSWIAAHEHVPAILVRHPLNRGLPHARNTALDFARGRYAFILDADNEIYPQCLESLVAALDADEEAVFAYGILQRFDDGGPFGLASLLPWQPERLRGGNYIDAMALIRTAFLRARGGFTTDHRLHGWEDYDLWCDVAERGSRAAFVPQIVGRYRVASDSMLSLTNLSTTVAFDVLAERYPGLMAGIGPT